MLPRASSCGIANILVLFLCSCHMSHRQSQATAQSVVIVSNLIPILLDVQPETREIHPWRECCGDHMPIIAFIVFLTYSTDSSVPPGKINLSIANPSRSSHRACIVFSNSAVASASDGDGQPLLFSVVSTKRPQGLLVKRLSRSAHDGVLTHAASAIALRKQRAVASENRRCSPGCEGGEVRGTRVDGRDVAVEQHQADVGRFSGREQRPDAGPRAACADEERRGL